MHSQNGLDIEVEGHCGGLLAGHMSPFKCRSRIQESIPNSSLSRKHSTPTTHLQDSALGSAQTAYGISQRRKFGFRLPTFAILGTPQFDDQECDTSQHERLSDSEYRRQLGSNMTSGSSPLLTPPLEENAVVRKLSGSRHENSNYITVSSSREVSSMQSHNSSERSLTRSPPALNLSAPLPVAHQAHLQGSSWVARVSQIILSLLYELRSMHQIQMVSQTMPSQAKEGRSRPTFEEMLSAIQMGMELSPFITITHAVPQARIMEELPKTPPSTPNARHDVNDYFGGDQTIFTHAAVVPIYHTYGRTDLSSATRLPHHIAAPYSVQVSILERYIPPTMGLEVIDFFSLSSQSYLADRLSELSANKGVLTLIYPTKTGASTFVRKYLSPVLDPLLRQFVLLNNLTSDAAASLGRMAAVEKMMEFTQMAKGIETMCGNLTQRPAIRGTRTAYTVVHSEAVEVTLDRSTWVNWFIEQEQPRMRQNLVEYHQAGGRMPGSTGHKEITTGMLTRELIDGIQKSREPAGDAGIEVGIFVLTRSMIA